MAGSNVPYPGLGPTGFIAPAESAILAGAQADYNAAFGGNLNNSLTDLSTPQAQLTMSEAAIIGDANNQFLYLTNNVDPAFASGRMQDAIGEIYFLTRLPGAATTVMVTCTGLAGVTIPEGAKVLDTEGNIYAATGGAAIPAGGSVTLEFACTQIGPVVCPVGAIVALYQPMAGWDGVANAAAGVTGAFPESRAHFEARRAASVTWNAAGSVPSLLDVVLSLEGVTDAYAIDNASGAPLTIGDYTLVPYSIYVAVAYDAAQGGDPNIIAQAIWSKKAPGCAYNGSTTVTVFDPNPAFLNPPEYQVSFQVPAPAPVYFGVSLVNGSSVPANAADLLAASIAKAFAGDDGGPRARIGATLYASRYYAAVAAAGAWAQIVSVQIGFAPGALQNDITVGIDQIPTFTGAGNIILTLV